MPDDSRLVFAQPTCSLVRWLLDPGQAVSPQVRSSLLGELFATPGVWVAGLFNALMFDTAALCLHGGPVFVALMPMDVFLIALRYGVLIRVRKAAAAQRRTGTDFYFVVSGSWCLLQGAVAFCAMRTGIVALQVLSAATVMSHIGLLCSRNYPAPRYAMMLVCFCILPFVAGASLSTNLWLLPLALQAPLISFGALSVLRRYRSISIATLQAGQDSHHRARHDPLTGLPNRLGLAESLEAQCRGQAACFTLFYLDLDGFKAINDRFGHEGGDRMLCAVAGRLAASVRAGDVVARMGGDEFVIVAPGMTAGAGVRLAEDIIKRVAAEPYQIEDAGLLRVGVSVGIACAPEDGLTESELHRGADAALYEAKRAGRGVWRRPAIPGPATWPLSA